jgi:hypothetical protein
MQLIINRKWAIAVGALLAFPTAWFILISLLKYGLGSPYLFDSSQPLLKSMGIKAALGFNINLLILSGPLLALVLNLFAVFKIDWYNYRDNFSVKFSVQKHWWNIMMVFLSGVLLLILFVYAFGENCHC